MPDNYLDDESLPTVTNGRLSKPYPIRTRGDVNRARVLPPSVDEKAPPAYKRGLDLGTEIARKQREKKAAPAESEQPQGGFDYVRKRNQLMKGVRNTRVRGARRVSRA